ncbi:N-formylglutamate amidohydrolase [Mesorhizobium muleiense]|uniref:N-formylglutamate amidohydrolase n=1 Tax=Mesorhizobium muleiense TaxID=1004279 RepID=UPI003AFADE35
MNKFDSFHLAHSDPSPLIEVNRDIESKFFVVCEHAGREIPKCLGNLGIDPVEMNRHIAYDIGAEAVSRKLADILVAPLYMQRYSRLIIDCNRPFNSDALIPEVSDGTEIPCNFGLTKEERRLRYETLHRSFHEAVSAGLDGAQSRGQLPVLLNIHSFTPVMRQTGETRTVEFGCCFNKSGHLAEAILAEAKNRFPGLVGALNEPYGVTDTGDYTIPFHGEQRQIPHVLIEIRNDLILDELGQRRWAAIIAQASLAAVKNMKAGIYQAGVPSKIGF